MTQTPDRPDADEPPGEPAGRRAKPVMPTADEAAAARAGQPPQPRPVRYAFVLWALAGAFNVINGISAVASKQSLIDSWLRTKEANIPNEQIIRGANTLVWGFLLASVAFAVLFTLFAYKAQQGVRRARLMLLMLWVITVLFHIAILPTQFGLVTALLATAGTVLLSLPASNVYFRPGDLPT